MVCRSAVLVWLVVPLASSVAVADSRDDPFKKGRDAIAKGNADEACGYFEQAHEADAREPAVLLNLGLCNEMRGRIATALRWFREAATQAGDRGAADYKRAADERMQKLTPNVPLLKLDVSKAPPDVEIRIDKVFIKREQYPLLEIDAGKHELEARAKGKQTITITFDVLNKHDEQTQTIPEMKQALPPIEVDRGRNRKFLAYGLGGVGVAFGTACLLYNLHVQGLADPSQTSNPIQPSDARHRIRVYGTPLFVAAVGALGAGVILYVTAPGKELRERTSFAPIISSDQLGFAVSGAF